ncbi:pyruvate ferredoxin oxidoreductase [Rhizomicrobium electricum]|uniref:Pyruvate ferredoxin oxidoreductase subunit alpha n=1 Tax=Rhizomicrobium electricum TaxID=480070 RepID=A0ABN1EW71_9PROT|nr:pyruvate ferredoxin oxidoreductase [Rhizomicrobium electricum]NIJ50044.1 pyruvate/2-oxoacid:ferredoxin oxidoreductase alpha subunit [Rhizomicrobium electricum]
MSLELLSANHGAAMAATLAARANRKGRGFVSGVYPITPSTECMEFLCNQKIEKSHVVRVESEHSAMGVCIGGAAAGARTFTATSSNGLAYMVENCITAATMRFPVVIAVANRTLGPPWNIWADHGDALILRDAGIIQFFCADNQEVFDSVLCGFRLAEDKRVMMPVMVCMEGFILSHRTAQTDVPEQDKVDAFLPPTDVPHRLAQIPHTLGQIEVPHQTEMHRMQHHAAMLDVPAIYREIQDEFEKIFGRRPPDMLVPYKADDAETLIVSMGTIPITAERVVDDLRAQGKKVGSLRVRLFRPLPVEAIGRVFAGKKRIAVIDRNIGLGMGGVLWQDTRALADPGTVVQDYLAGMGGGDIRPEHIVKMVEDIEARTASGAPKLMEMV